MKGLNMNLLRFSFVFLLILPLSACSLSGGAIEGRVLEEGTDKPIEDAIVIVRWKGYVSAIVDTQTVCVHVESATTDKRGNYKVSGWSKPSTMGPAFDVKPVVSAYKVGYGLPSTPAQKDEDVYLASSKGTSGERLEYLKRIYGATDCGAQNGSGKNMLPFLKALYEEAKLHGGDKKPAPNEMSLLESLRYEIEIIELGFEQAEKRHLQRP
jgi:hypothetical protein